ncbi:MAG: tRNA (N(6)-L-threonylcarbamoyladenosine(37)-C(2))-methylthiotransferase MtaB [Candidatus Marinimicrobia bacterium]|nr:tRNA (N(6)-L-threonylcarbamoyladenosine(37)-C(2))-methylthiotransferase MtaB [Candidatus Neomarinimicrobiota bacterium]
MSSPFKTAALHTLGCKVNFTETSMIAKQFQEDGLSLVSIDQFADIYVLNTCSVTENANIKCNRLVKKLKRINPNAFIVITGCYAQLKSDELSKNNDIDLVVGSESKLNIPEIIKKEMNSKLVTSKFDSIESFSLSYSSGDRVRSFIKVQDGCDYNCTFCTIPLARGKSRSSKISEIVDVVNSLDRKGYKEVVLSGINLGDFGNGSNQNCFQLFQEIEKSTSIPRIRISSIEPNLLSDNIINLIASSKRFMPHFHIPLQSGSDRILKLMKRKYNVRFYSNKINKIKSIIPNASIGVDVIVGFPTETDDEFNETYNLLSDLEVSYLHVFTYSERENTIAINLKPKVAQEVRNTRSKKLRALSEYLKSQFIIKNMNTNHTILVEGVHDNVLHGYTENYIKFHVNSNQMKINDLVNVKPLDSSYGTITGKTV